IDPNSKVAKSSDCIIQMPREDLRFLKYLEQNSGQNYLEHIRIISEEDLAKNPLMPRRLGRISSKFIACGLHQHAIPSILADQLSFLRAQNPNKSHFRIAILNGHGANLGDNLIGATAFRSVAALMQKLLPSFSVDILFGSCHNPALRSLLENDPFIEQIRFKALNLAEFAEYDGYFDTSPLPDLPGFNTQAYVDWYLWWYGLDPSEISPLAKRNKVAIHEEVWNQVANQLAKVKGPKLLFVPNTSTALRTYPPDLAKILVADLLKTSPNFTILSTIDLGLTHPRLLNLEGKTGDTEHFMALIAQVEACISAESFTPHVCDACAIPCVTLSAALPKEFFPYYPKAKFIEIPNLRELPGFRQCLIKDELWPSMQEAYHNSWSKLSAKQILEALHDLALQPKVDSHLELLSHKAPKGFLTGEGVDLHFKYEKLNSDFIKAHAWFLAQFKALFPVGGTCVLAMPAEASFVAALSLEITQREGQLIIFEPRPLKAKLWMSLGLQVGCLNFKIIPKVPLPGTHFAFPDFDPYSESQAGTFGNTKNQSLTVEAQSLDALNLETCHIILVQPPIQLEAFLDGANKTFKKFHPLLLAAPLTKNLNLIASKLKNIQYEGKVISFATTFGLIAYFKAN
ncbi:MAG: hypothetical protein IJU40_08565, partial [Desulfovibrionaceae bacterium]|nr:hypothetical protein [Desulfovibrionaceae bacterium]